MDEINHRFDYLVDQSSQLVDTSQKYSFEVIDQAKGSIHFEGLNISYFRYTQANQQVFGFKIGSLAYITDIKHYSDDIFSFLEGTDLLFISALRRGTSPVHFNIDDAEEFARKVGAAKAYGIHLSSEVNYRQEMFKLGGSFLLGYDGLVEEFSYG
jgi:phosphoribosyl 1,2-cyclic phosphate phosphodiesterase